MAPTVSRHQNHHTWPGRLLHSGRQWSLASCNSNCRSISSDSELLRSCHKYCQEFISRLKTGIVAKNTDIPENDGIIIQKIIDLSAASTVQADTNKCTLIKRARDLDKRNYSMRSIARILNLDFRTVRKYIHMEKDQILTIRKTFVDYTVYLDDLIEGYRKGESLSLIFRRIKIKGFKGSLRGLTIRFGKLYKGRMERRGSCVSKKKP